MFFLKATNTLKTYFGWLTFKLIFEKGFLFWKKKQCFIFVSFLLLSPSSSLLLISRIRRFTIFCFNCSFGAQIMRMYMKTGSLHTLHKWWVRKNKRHWHFKYFSVPFFQHDKGMVMFKPRVAMITFDYNLHSVGRWIISFPLIFKPKLLYDP